MGSYNSEYESYYNNIKRKNINSYPYRASTEKKSNMSFITRRLLVDLIGVLFLFGFVIVCKLVATPQTKAAYDYSKKMISENFDYKAAYSKLKDINIQDFSFNKLTDSFTNWISNLKWGNKN